MKKLQRTLSLPGAIAVSIGGMLSGIFVLPGLAVGITGSSIWLAFLVAALCILPAVLSKSELATAMPKSGGTYVYIERAFGPLFGTIAGIGLWLSLLLKSAFSLVGLSAYLYVLIEVDSGLTKSIALLALLVILLLNVFGVKKVEKKSFTQRTDESTKQIADTSGETKKVDKPQYRSLTDSKVVSPKSISEIKNRANPPDFNL